MRTKKPFQHKSVPQTNVGLTHNPRTELSSFIQGNGKKNTVQTQQSERTRGTRSLRHTPPQRGRGDSPASWVGHSVSPDVHRQIPRSPTKIPAGLSVETHRLIFKFISKRKGPKIVLEIVLQKSKLQELHWIWNFLWPQWSGHCGIGTRTGTLIDAM